MYFVLFGMWRSFWVFLKKFFHPMGYFAPLRGIPYETRFDLRFHERKEVKTLEQEKFVEAVHTYGDMVYRVACHALRNPACRIR